MHQEGVYFFTLWNVGGTVIYSDEQNMAEVALCDLWASRNLKSFHSCPLEMLFPWEQAQAFWRGHVVRSTASELMWEWLSLITKVIGVSLEETSERTPSWTQTRLPIHRMWGNNNNKKGYCFGPLSLGLTCYVAIDHRYHRWNPPRYKEIIHHDKGRCTPRIQGWFCMRKSFKCNLPP